MGRVKIIADSVSDIPKKYIEDLDIEVVPLTINFEDGSYRDGIDISTEEFYRKMGCSDKLPTTSQVTPKEFIDIYNKFKDDYEHIIVLTISSEMSGTYQSAMMAKKIIGLEDRITVIDSRGITLGQGLMAIEGARMAKVDENKDVIIDRLKDMVNHMDYIFVVDTLENLKKGGRLSVTKAFIGEKLKIKPVLNIENGKLTLKDKIRGRKKVIKWVIKKIKKMDMDFKDMTIGVNHTEAEEFAMELKEALEKELKPKEIIFGKVGATVGTHAGIGAIAVYFENPLKKA